VHPLSLSPGRVQEIEAHLFLIFTGIKRKATEIESRKVQNFAAKMATLKSMRQMASRGCEILSGEHSLHEFGVLLDQAWQAKKSLEVAVSSNEIDGLYRQGIEAGAWGGKLLGAGGGGFIMFIAPPESHESLRAALPGLYTLDVKINAPGSRIIFS